MNQTRSALIFVTREADEISYFLLHKRTQSKISWFKSFSFISSSPIFFYFFFKKNFSHFYHNDDSNAHWTFLWNEKWMKIQKKISSFHFLNYNLNVRDKDIKICFDNAMRSEYRKWEMHTKKYLPMSISNLYINLNKNALLL